MTLINTSFINLVGTSIDALHSNVKLLGVTVFNGIRCDLGCGISAYSSNVEFLGTAAFQNNTCSCGCGIAASITNISFDGSATFEGNMADVSGSGIYAEHSNTDFFLAGLCFRTVYVPSVVV